MSSVRTHDQVLVWFIERWIEQFGDPPLVPVSELRPALEVHLMLDDNHEFIRVTCSNPDCPDADGTDPYP